VQRGITRLTGLSFYICALYRDLTEEEGIMLQCIRDFSLKMRRRQRFERMLTELKGYSERELYELGIPPADIRRVAWAATRAAS